MHFQFVNLQLIAVTVLKAMDDVCILDCIVNLQIERVTLKISVMIIISYDNNTLRERNLLSEECFAFH